MIEQSGAADKTDRVPARGAGALGALLLVVGLLLIVTGVIARTHAFGGVGNATDDQRATATALRGRAEQALAGATRALEPKAMAAARLPGIVSALDLDADAHTFEDLLDNEDWWAPYRSEFSLSGVLTGDGTLAMTGPGSADLGSATAVRQARDAGIASGVVAISGRALHDRCGAHAARQARRGRDRDPRRAARAGGAAGRRRRRRDRGRGVGRPAAARVRGPGSPRRRCWDR